MQKAPGENTPEASSPPTNSPILDDPCAYIRVVTGRMPPTELVELEAYRRFFAAGPGAHTAGVGGAALLALPGVPSTMLNRVAGLGVAEPATEQHLDEIDAFYEPFGVEYAVAVAPQARPAELTGMLAERGFASGYAWTKFTRAADEPSASITDLRVELVGADGGDDFALVVAEAYEMPPATSGLLAVTPQLEGYSCFVAYADDEPAAAGAVVVIGETGWLGFGATRPAFRRRGGQRALFAARARRAVELGASTLVTETGELLPGRPSSSYRNILRAGFRPAYVRPNFLSPA
jgi:GNAT superfamily N-acetyltransferase